MPHREPTSRTLAEPDGWAWRPFAQQGQLDFELGFFERLLKRSPNNVMVLRLLGELLNRKGLHHEALQIDQRLVALVPKDEVAHYNLACSLAQTGQMQPALEALRTALALGYADFEHLACDPDLQALRGEQGYLELLRQYAPQMAAGEQ
jgi:predicted Zn-dependent protease